MGTLVTNHCGVTGTPLPIPRWSSSARLRCRLWPSLDLYCVTPFVISPRYGPLLSGTQSALNTSKGKLKAGTVLPLVIGSLMLMSCGGGQQTVGNSPSISITVSPSASTLSPSQSQQMVAIVSGTTDSGVVWTVNGVQGGNSATGTVSSTGLYLAPPAAPVGGSVTVAAISVADNSKNANAVITIYNRVNLSPALVTMATGGTQQFVAAVNGVSDSAVRWMVNGVAAGNAMVGSISTGGVYTAPGVVPNSAVIVAAVDASNSFATASATVAVITPGALDAHEQWLSGVADAAASYGCLDIAVQQQSTESIADVLNRFGLTASEGSCLVLRPISTDPGSIRYSLAWGGMIGGKDILYISDVGQMRIWDNVPVATN